MPKIFKRKLTFFLFTFFLIFQAITGIFLPVNFSFEPPFIEPQEVSAAGENWYASNYLYRKEIIIDSDQVATTTSAFPVLISTTTIESLKTVVNGGKVQSDSGYDIVFTDSDGQTLLNYEREKYSSSTGEIVYWVKTDISSTTDKSLYQVGGREKISYNVVSD